MTVVAEMKAQWPGYFEQLYSADPPAVELDVNPPIADPAMDVPISDPPINCDPPSFVEIQATGNRLKWGKAPGISCIHAELLKTGENAALISLHAVLCSVWNTGIIPIDWKRGLVVPLWKGKGDRRTATTTEGVMLLSVPCKLEKFSESY